MADKTKNELLSDIKHLKKTNERLVKKNDDLNETADKKLAGKTKIVEPPAMINKPRAVAALKDLKKIKCCSHLEKFIDALLLFVESHCF